MDKKTFLAELQKNLAVLQEEELRDIINEYEQHIDMKMQSGLSEEEATADFGSLDELTAEILEAYHVRSDYASGSQKNLDASDKPSDHKAAAFFHKIGDGLARVASALLALAGSMMIWVRNVIIWLWRQISRPFIYLWNLCKAKRQEHGYEHEHPYVQEWNVAQDGNEASDSFSGINSEPISCEALGSVRVENPKLVCDENSGSVRNGNLGPVCDENSGSVKDKNAGSVNDETPDMGRDKAYGPGRGVNQYTAKDKTYGSARNVNQYTANNEAYGSGRDVTRRSRTGKLKAIWRKLCGGVTSCVHCCLKAALWCVFAIWNICWAGCALLAALCGLVFLFGLGTLTVLMISGYPLAGITLACLGITLCAFSVSLLGLTLIRHVKKEQAQNDLPQYKGEEE